MQTNNNFGQIKRGLGLVAFAMAFAVQGQAATRDGTDGSGNVGKGKIRSIEAVQAQVAKFRTEIAAHLAKQVVELKSGSDAAKTSSADHLNNAKANEDAGAWMSTSGALLKSLELDGSAVAGVQGALGKDSAKWNYFSAVLSKLSPEQLQKFNADADYRDAILKVASNFGSIDTGASKADGSADFATVVAGYDTVTLQSLAGLRMTAGKAMIRRIQLLTKDTQNSEEAGAALRAYLTAGGVSAERANQLVSAFQSKVKAGGDSLEHFELELRSGRSKEAQEVRAEIYALEAWAVLKGKGISKQEFEQLMSSCGLKPALA